MNDPATGPHFRGPLSRRAFLRSSVRGTVLGAGALKVGLIPEHLFGLDPRRTVGPGSRMATGPASPSSGSAGPPRSLDLLVLGGTGFIGPYQVRYALERGHRVTVFNRGRSEADLPDGIEELIGDRNDDLSALEGRRWDAVIDNPTTLPNWVRLSGRLLEEATDRYLFISTISVYADASQPGRDEDTPLLEYQGDQDPYTLTPSEASSHYGALKAMSEREVERWFGPRATIVRPGLIVGPEDPTDRFTYWPVRIHRGGRVLAPGNPSDPTQIIDARDLAEWTIRLVEDDRGGRFNATGPAEPRPIGDMLEGIRDALGAQASFAWVDAASLEEAGIRPWSDMPVWMPPDEDRAGFMQVSVERARAAGLTYRPLTQTARDTLAWFQTLPTSRQDELQAGLDPEREARVLQALAGG